MKAGSIIFETKIDNKNFEKQIDQVEGRIEEIETMLSHPKEFGLSKEEIAKLNVELEKAKNKLGTLVKKQNEMNKIGFEEVSSSLNGVIKKVGKWALAVFGVRSAYSAIRSAMGILSKYNGQLATDLEYIQYALAKTLEPVIQIIIKLAYRLLALLNSIAEAWFNINLFANAGVNNFKKMNSSANALKKTLLGFDTANILGDTSAGGISETFTPQIDLSQLDGEKEKMRSFWSGIIQFWEKDWEDFFSIKGNWDTFIYGLGLTLSGFYDLFAGIIDAIKGVFQIAVGLFNDDFDLIEEGWNSLWEGCKKIVLGAINIITGIVLTGLGFIKGIFLDLWNGIKSIFAGIGNWFNNNVIKPIQNAFNKLPNWMQTLIKGIVNVAITSINFLLNAINNLLFPVRSLIVALGKVTGKSWTLSTVKIPTIPKLAVGGIVNLPGRGVMYGGANIGERGAEGVIPLTNDQSLQMIADAIAQKMNVTLDITNKIDSRVLNRQLEQVKAKNTFARNGV